MYNQDGTVTQDMRRKEEKYRYGKDMKKKEEEEKKKKDKKKYKKSILSKPSSTLKRKNKQKEAVTQTSFLPLLCCFPSDLLAA